MLFKVQWCHSLQVELIYFSVNKLGISLLTSYLDFKIIIVIVMKLLENALLDGISAALCMDTGDCKITGRY